MADTTWCRKCNMATGSSNISETMTHIIKIPAANTRHSTMANSQKVYLGDYNNERQSKTAAETGNTISMKLLVRYS